MEFFLYETIMNKKTHLQKCIKNKLIFLIVIVRNPTPFNSLSFHIIT
jgi:hypothetical protein